MPPAAVQQAAEAPIKRPRLGFWLAMIAAIPAAIIGAFIGPPIQRWWQGINEPPPLVDFRCAPSEVLVKEILTCQNFSLHATSFRWDFGDGKPPLDPPGLEPVHHSYEVAGTYQVRVMALENNGRDSYPSAHQTIKVLQDPNQLDELLEVGLFGILPQGLERQTKIYSVDETVRVNLARPSEIQSFEKIYPASPGFRIESVLFSTSEEKSLGSPFVEKSADLSEAVVRFSLSVDASKGIPRSWVKGSVLITEVRASKTPKVVLVPRLRIGRLGRFSLPSTLDLSHFQKWGVQDLDGLDLDSAKLESSLTLVREGVQLSLTFQRDNWSLLVTRLNLPPDL